MASTAQEVFTYVQKLSAVEYTDFASLGLLAYDYCLTFEREFHLIWKDRGPWKIGKILFFLTRYPPFIGGFLSLYVDVIRFLPLPACTKWTQATVYTLSVEIMIAEVILTMRVRALWASSRRVTTLLVVIAVGLLVMVLYKVATVQAGAETIFDEVLYSRFGVCPPSYNHDNAITICFIALMSYESVIFTLTGIRAWQLRHLTRDSHFIYGFFTYGFSYNFVILASSTANIIVRHKTSSAHVNLLTSLQPVVHSILTSRMMLDLREQAATATRYGIPTTEGPGTLRFTTPVAAYSTGFIDDSDPGSFSDYGSTNNVRSWFGEDLPVASGASGQVSTMH